ncbi:MAG: hypothetical protein JW910_17995 [Anaerolineae bacterium]|nr:hypothetical protein [Anaerolineae bacterium]
MGAEERPLTSAQNRAFWRAIHSVAHPVTLGAVLLLLLNDHWLRYQSPSWLTGKLSDAAWLALAPLIAATAFAWLVPRRVERQTQIVGGLAFGFIGLWFALGKTVPFVHALMTNVLSGLVGWEVTLRLDATDLITLSALLIGWWVWRQADDAPSLRRPFVTVVYALGLFGTLATSPGMTDYGITCLFPQEDATLIALNDGTYLRRFFVSTDGGFTWEETEDITIEESCTYWNREEILLTDPEDEETLYRLYSGESIQRSSDGGATWTQAYDPEVVNQDVRAYYRAMDYVGTGQTMYRPGPLDAVFDPTSHNLVIAMGLNGILLRTPDDQWQWIEVGPYALDDIHRPSMIPTIVSPQLPHAIVLGALAFASIVLTRRHNWRGGLLVLGWAGWIISIALLSATLDFFAAPIVIGVVGFTALIAIVLGLITIYDLRREHRMWLTFAGLAALAVAVLFLLPYALWSQGTIPRYRTASVFAVVLAGAMLVTARSYFLARVFPAIPWRKPSSDDA